MAEPEPELSKAERKRREKLAKAQAKAEARAKKERDVLQKQFEKQQREEARAAEKKRKEDPAFAAAADIEQAADDWHVFSMQPGLALRVEEARDLCGRAKDKPVNAYVIVKYSGESFRTDTANDSANPVWREFFTFPDCPETGHVEIEIWDQRFLGRDAPLGMVGLKAQQVLDLQDQSVERNLDIWSYLQPLGSCASPTGSIRLIATMGDRKTKRRLRSSAKGSKAKHVSTEHSLDKHSPDKGQKFRSRKELIEATAAARAAAAQAKAKEEVEAYLVELDRQRIEAQAAVAVAESKMLEADAVAKKEEQERQDAEQQLAAARKEEEVAAEVAAQEDAELLLAEQKAAKEKADLDAARENVKNIEAALAEAQKTSNVEDEESLLRELQQARQTEMAEQADYQAAEEHRAKEEIEARHARNVLIQETTDVEVAQQAYAREAEQARVAAEEFQAATAVEEEAKQIALSITTKEDEAIHEAEDNEDAATMQTDPQSSLPATTSSEEKIVQDDSPQGVEVQRKINQIGGSKYSAAARRNEEEAARGTDWERTKTAEGKRKWRNQRALLAGTWSRGPGSRLTPGLYSANRLEPRSPTPSAVRAHEQKITGRAARSREYQRRRRAIAATYPTLATPLEPDMKAWGKRAPPPFHPPPNKPRIAGKLLKWRPAVLKDSGGVDKAWRTRWVELCMETKVYPAFETLEEEQDFLKVEIEEDLRSLGKSQNDIDDIFQSIKHPLRERRADDIHVAELLFSAEAEDRRKRRALRPVLSYCHSRGGRELGRLDLRGATLTRSYRPHQAQQAAPGMRPLKPSDLGSNLDDDDACNASRRLQHLVGEGPRAQLLEELCLKCIREPWEPRQLRVADLSQSESAGGGLLDAACGRAYLTVTATDPHGGLPHVVPPEPTWEHQIKRLRGEVPKSSRLDACLALMEARGDPRRAKIRLCDASKHPKQEDVANLLRASVVSTTISATFSCDKTGTAAEDYLQGWFEQMRYAIWETDLSAGRSPWETDTQPERQPPPQEGPRSFDPPGGPQDGPVFKKIGHPAYFLPPPASLYAVRGKLRHELEMNAQRYVPFNSGLYRQMTNEMEAAAATQAAMQWRAGGKATNGGVRWSPLLGERKATVMKAFAVVTEGNAEGKSVGEVAADAA